jgi:hypothetical protein
LLSIIVLFVFDVAGTSIVDAGTITADSVVAIGSIGKLTRRPSGGWAIRLDAGRAALSVAALGKF